MVTTITRVTETETKEPGPVDPVLRKALERKSLADEQLKRVEAGKVGQHEMFCCSAAKKSDVNTAKKHVKHWNDFLATRATLTASQSEMDFDDDEDDEEEDDDEREARYFRAG